MARTRPSRTRARLLAVAGATAALAGAGTAAAATASAATPPIRVPASADPAPLTGNTGITGVLTTPAAHPATHAVTRAARTVAVTRPAGAAHVVRHHAAAPARPYQMYDSVTPAAIPAGHAIATYADGAYAASPSQLHGRAHITWIDTNATDPTGATALDVEPGDATPAQAATWASQHLTAHPASHAIIYTMRSDWAATQASIGSLPHWMQHHVRWWIADPTGVPHTVPGATATQWYWGTHYDISTVNPGF